MTRTREFSFMIRLTAKEKQDLADFAELNDLSQAQVVRKALKEYLSQFNQEPE